MPILKFSGMLLIIMAGWAIGFTIAKKFRQRPLQLRAFQSSLLMLQTEISYTATPLPEALSRVARRCEPPIQDFLSGGSETIELRAGLDRGRGLGQHPFRLAADICFTVRRYQYFTKPGG